MIFICLTLALSDQTLLYIPRASEKKNTARPRRKLFQISCWFDFRITIEADSWISLGRKINQRGSKDANCPHAEFMNERKGETSYRLWHDIPNVLEDT